MDISKAIQATAPVVEPTPRRQQHADGFSYEWDGVHGVINTGPVAEQPRTWDEFILDSGLDPNEVEVVEPVQVRGWDAPTGDGNVTRMRYYRITVQRRTRPGADIADLIKAAKRRSSTRPQLTKDDAAFLLALGDLQLGKIDGDGVEGTVQRYMDSTAAAVARYKRIAKGAPVYVAHLGDCIEGFMSQGGANAWRTCLTTTEQVRLYRRLLLDQVKAFAAVAPQVVIATVPGNHDEAHRPLHTYGDSWAIDAASAVRDALELAGNYEHVTIHAPARDELTLTLDIAGTIVGFAHGHQWRAGQATTWWAKQSHGRQPIGDADLLISAHLHHLRVEHTGSNKTWMQVPALESGSQWWKHRTGEWGQPGVLTMMVGDGKWSQLEIL